MSVPMVADGCGWLPVVACAGELADGPGLAAQGPDKAPNPLILLENAQPYAERDRCGPSGNTWRARREVTQSEEFYAATVAKQVR